MSKYTWLLDPGHGGMINGKYQTAGKRSPNWKDGYQQLFEGEFNRAIVARLKEMCNQSNIKYVDMCPTDADIRLKTRVDAANALHNKGEKCIYLSIHSNAGGGKGFEVFTSRGKTGSDKIATIFLNSFKSTFAHDENIRFRTDFSDGDPDKEANFYVLKQTRMWAILTENLFMDNQYECKRYLLTKEGRDLIAQAHFKAMIEIETGV
ncbi:MAG: N-acetylmuramoyl-L-alanine amidase [Bacteroidota bacterium]